MSKPTSPREKAADDQTHTAFIVRRWQVGFTHKNDALLLDIPRHGIFAWSLPEAEKMVVEMIKRIEVLRERKKAKEAAPPTDTRQ